MKLPVRLTPRDRYLSEREITVLWQTLDQGTDPLAGAYKAVLLTACRPGEVLGLRWEEISEDGLWWVIPEARSKNGLAHRVFLTPPLREILAARRTAAGASPFLFPTTRDGSSPLRFQTSTKLRKSIGFEFNPHDLRRTASTHLRFIGTTGVRKQDFVPAGSGGLVEPGGLAFGPDGNLYVASGGAGQILRYDGRTGAPLGVFAQGGGMRGPLYLLFGP